MKAFILLALLAVLLTSYVDAHKSVRVMKPETDEERHLHHMMHYRKTHTQSPREKTHHEEKMAELNHPYVRHSPSYHHKVGPEYHDVHPDFIRASHKRPARFDSHGNHIPDEILDETIMSLHHK